MRCLVPLLGFVAMLAVVPARAELPKPEKFDETGFVKILEPIHDRGDFVRAY